MLPLLVSSRPSSSSRRTANSRSSANSAQSANSFANSFSCANSGTNICANSFNCANCSANFSANTSNLNQNAGKTARKMTATASATTPGAKHYEAQPPPLLKHCATDANNNCIKISIPCSSASIAATADDATPPQNVPSTSTSPIFNDRKYPPQQSASAPTAVAESTAVDASAIDTPENGASSALIPLHLRNSPSFTMRWGEKLSAVAERISSKLLLPGRNSSSASANGVGGGTNEARKCFVETLYPEQCVEKASLIPIFVDEGAAAPFAAQSDGDANDGAVAGVYNSDERQCRICLLSSSADASSAPTRTKKRRKLIAPCRCAGTVQYVHISCLTHWIEVSSRKMYSIPKCELCGYKFRRKPFIDLTRVHFPYVDWCDRILNTLFLFLVAIMILCGWVAVHYLCLAERRPLIRPSRHTNSKRFLTDNDVTVIIASILFFAAFFIALFTQYRAEVNVFRILTRMWATNRNWRIRDYDARFDDERAVGELERGGGDGGDAAPFHPTDAIVSVEFVEYDEDGDG